ncbi:MAG TPA: hypothetical protein VML55_13630 [Planctomycetaceae bacterium]|nr:hypothetical protein [Planctomycetaceae bacterium]
MQVPLNQGVFTFSLDFELAWGTRGRRYASSVPPFLDGTRVAVAGLLKLFEKYEVSATWAIVGALLTGSDDGGKHPLLDGPAFADVPAGNARTAPHWYAEDVIESIRGCPVPQEIGCHTLSHLYVDPALTGREAFRRDLHGFRRLFDELGLAQPGSFIFPKAIMGHFDVLAETGFRCYRGPESKWFERLPGVLAPAAMRMVDARLALPPTVGSPSLGPEGLWVIPSSQFYSPFMSVGRYVSVAARVRKALEGLRRAAQRRQVFHLWTHPFNLGCRTRELLAGLEQIVAEARRLCDAGELEICSMGAIARQLDERYAMAAPSAALAVN